jgi:hypothetical protein
MEDKYSEYVYSAKDIEKAFDMGLDTAFGIMEKSIGLSVGGQRHLLDRMKKKIIESKISAVKIA